MRKHRGSPDTLTCKKESVKLLLAGASLSILLAMGCSLALPLDAAISLPETPSDTSQQRGSNDPLASASAAAPHANDALAIAPIRDRPASLIRQRGSITGSGSASPTSDSTTIEDPIASAVTSAPQPAVSAAQPKPSSIPIADRLARAPVDAMVGQINGRPLFASEFFAPMDARLRAEAQRRTPEDWLRFARGEIQKALRDRIRNELLLAEVESSLTPGQRAGLVTFVRSLRENLVSENRGSHEMANRKLLEDEGITLEQAVQARRDEELIRSWLGQILRNKVTISWRDVEQRYERDYEKYHPPASATLRMIRIPASNTDAIQAVQRGLDNGQDFASLATLFSTWKPKEGGLYTRQLDADTYEQSTMFGLPDLNTAAQKLSLGQYVGPLEMSDGNMHWVILEKIAQSSQSLYDVQLQIQRELFNERVNDEEGEYFDKLLQRSGLMTSNLIDQMQARLFDLAAERYILSR